jgi:putative NADH-flavin reductase
MPILDRFFGATYADMGAMEQVLGGSELDWSCLRPPRLIDKSATGHYRIDVNQPLPKARTLTFADLAAALLDSLDRADLYRRCAYVAN